MLQLRVFGVAGAMTDVSELLSEVPGARHIIRTEGLVTAELVPTAVDPALAALKHLEIDDADVSLVRLDTVQPGERRRDTASLVLSDLLGQAGENARPVARYLVFMAVAGVIAAYGVIYANVILIVGAMAVSPDLLPITSICVGLALGRHRLVRRAFVALAAGLGTATLMAGVLTAILDGVDLLPGSFAVGESALHGLTTVNSSTFVVAFVAGVAGMLSVETRASAAVGVAISVTTIPASAYLGVAAGVGEVDKAAGALLVLGINVAMLVAGGTATLLTQEALSRRPRSSRSGDDASGGDTPEFSPSR